MAALEKLYHKSLIGPLQKHHEGFIKSIIKAL